MSDRSSTELRLRALAKSVYIVNEKRADRGFQRFWKVHVMIDWDNYRTFWGDDNDEGKRIALLDALRWAQVNAPKVEGDDG